MVVMMQGEGEKLENKMFLGIQPGVWAVAIVLPAPGFTVSSMPLHGACEAVGEGGVSSHLCRVSNLLI